MAESSPNGSKTLWEKQKLLIMSNFSFSHCVFKRFVSQGRQKMSLCGNGLTPFSNITSVILCMPLHPNMFSWSFYTLLIQTIFFSLNSSSYPRSCFGSVLLYIHFFLDLSKIKAFAVSKSIVIPFEIGSLYYFVV